MDIAVIGANGMLGRALVAAFLGKKFLVTPLALPQFDLTDYHDMADELQKRSPQYVVNAAGFTDVDGCEDRQAEAFAVNGTAVGVLAQVCATIPAALVHFSTDYVFDGKEPAGYAEDAAPDPLSVYGKSKREGERLLQASGCRYLLIRTSWLFGPGRRDNVVEKIITRAKQDGKPKLVNDRWGKPTYARDLAERVVTMVSQNCAPGIYHLTNDTPPPGITWYEFGKEIVELLGLDVAVAPCRSEEFHQKAIRPVHSLLVNTKLPPLRPWREALEEYLKDQKT